MIKQIGPNGTGNEHFNHPEDVNLVQTELVMNNHPENVNIGPNGTGIKMLTNQMMSQWTMNEWCMLLNVIIIAFMLNIGWFIRSIGKKGSNK